MKAAQIVSEEVGTGSPVIRTRRHCHRAPSHQNDDHLRDDAMGVGLVLVQALLAPLEGDAEYSPNQKTARPLSSLGIMTETSRYGALDSQYEGLGVVLRSAAGT